MKAVPSVAIAATVLILHLAVLQPSAASPIAGGAGHHDEHLRRRDDYYDYYEGEEQNIGEQLACVWDVGLFDCMKAKKAADKASAMAAEYANSGQLTGIHNGPADAFRHCAWNAFMVHAIGEGQAQEVADNHEESSSGQPDAEKEMDKANNATGRQVGSSTPTDEAAKEECFQRAKNGALRTLV